MWNNNLTMKIIEYTFPSGPVQLKLRTLKKLPASVLDNIDVLINLLLNELNHNVMNSSARRFNEGQVGLPIFIEPEFIKYLNVNINYWLKEELNHLPFTSDSDIEGTSLTDYFFIDTESKSLIKKFPINFNSHTLKNPFMLDFIEKYLEEVGIDNFYISLDNLHITYGENEWVTELELPNVAPLTMKMRNEAVVVEPYKFIPDEDAIGKFANMDRRLSPIYLIIESQDIYKNKLLSKLTSKLQYQEDFRKFSHRHKIGLTAVLEGNELVNFVPVNI